MNKKFFEGMKTFALITLFAGIIAASILLFTSVFVKVKNGIYYTYEETVFSASGFVSMLFCLFGSIALYYIMKGIALLGLKAYESEQTPSEKKTDGSPIPEALKEEDRKKRDAKTTKIGLIILFILIAAILCLAFLQHQ